MKRQPINSSLAPPSNAPLNAWPVTPRAGLGQLCVSRRKRMVVQWAVAHVLHNPAMRQLPDTLLIVNIANGLLVTWRAN